MSPSARREGEVSLASPGGYSLHLRAIFVQEVSRECKNRTALFVASRFALYQQIFQPGLGISWEWGMYLNKRYTILADGSPSNYTQGCSPTHPCTGVDLTGLAGFRISFSSIRGAQEYFLCSGQDATSMSVSSMTRPTSTGKNFNGKKNRNIKTKQEEHDRRQIVYF